MKNAYLYVMAMLLAKYVPAQITALQIGQQMPAIQFSVEQNENKYDLNFSDLNSKWIVLDFWDVSCSACIHAMPKLDSLQHQFAGKIQILLITKNTKAEVTKLFSRVKIKRPSLPIVFHDSVFHRLLPHSARPHYAIINPTGVVRFITHGYNINEETFSALLKGESITLSYKEDLLNFDAKQSLIRESGGRLQPYLYCYSYFMKRIEGLGSRIGIYTNNEENRRGLRLINLPILDIYQLAYSRGISGDLNKDNRVILEVNDLSPFRMIEDSKQIQEWQSSHFYAYESAVPLSSDADLYSILQADLQKYFPYVAVVKKTKVKCIVIKQKSDAIINEEVKRTNDDDHKKISATLLQLLQKQFPSTPVVDSAKLKRTFLIESFIPLKSLEDIKKMMEKYGIELTEEEVQIDMLVIRDKKDQMKT